MRIFSGALILCGFILTTVSFTLYAQPDSTVSAKSEKVSQSAAEKLQQKILLTDKQTEGIENILNDYLKDISKKSYETAEKKIVSLLDHRQKIKFSIVQKDWWGTINKDAKVKPEE
jgi:predicted glycosyltransferase